MKNLITRLVSEEDGATMVEYGLMVALIAVVAIVGATALGNAVSGKFTSVSGSVTNAGGGTTP